MCARGVAALFREVTLAVPLLKAQALPQSPEQPPRLVEALGELTEEDPLLDMEQHAGRLIRDIVAMRGAFEPPIRHKGSLTSGKGVLSSRFAGYEPCALKLGRTARRRGIDSRDRAKWILHSRSALQGPKMVMPSSNI
ncbi:hypothetical protein D5272_08035 [bacterium D16-76]|nr:hypothetical protein [bacterium D16-76]